MSVAWDRMRGTYWESWQLTKVAETPRSVVVTEIFMLWLMPRLFGSVSKESTQA